MHSTASDARRALGRAPDGTPYLPPGVRLRLHHSVTTDVEHFAALADSDDRHRLVEAMHLVRGPLFDGLRRSDWAVFDGTRSRIESLVVGTALRCAEELTRARRRQRGRLGGPSGAEGEPLRRTALPLVAARDGGGGRPRRGALDDGRIADAGGGARTPRRLGCPGCSGAATIDSSASTRRRRPSTVACWRARLPPKGSSPGCRVASRHGEKLLWEIGSPRRLNGRWRHLSRADAGQLVCRARDHRRDRDRIGRPCQVPLQPDPDGGRADHEHDMARRPGLRHLRDHGAGAGGLPDRRDHRPDDHRQRRPAHRPQDGERGGQQRDVGQVRPGLLGPDADQHAGEVPVGHGARILERAEMRGRDSRRRQGR